MEQIKLTLEHREKLLEMCKELFPEYENVELEIEPQYDGSDGFIQLTRNLNNLLDFVNIHWFEFCMTYLAKIVLGKQVPRDITKRYKDFALECFMYSVKSKKYIHPIDYLYSEFLKLKNGK